ncbi:MAG: spermidine synthase [Candidatus Aminicenantes bacterium]|nr:spermidine synthase [Candidatus Aminicenantes bacterium]NIN17753.1 spermidine synthase [Candidatus Aminicenantes bacterium]NIN41654.1 spermidine synthase [Candidatus Aminicenantes bacterium]NIN84403.1 spermidine synthase [Candidatus Aminicenantes bacterium]NIO80552.1 spermidine synthase [Candidatus Aminicenantes bacterium]
MTEMNAAAHTGTKRRPARYIYYILFTVSGFSGLIYESIWTHYLKLFLGHAAYAQSLVLVIFMGGMALGAWGISRYSLKIRNLLIGYALVELIVGVLALLFHPVFVKVVNLAYTSLIPNINSLSNINLMKWTLAALLILPQSVLLGTTFPLMSGGVIRRYPDQPGRSLAILYFTNSLGGAVGILASGFLLMGRVGLPGTIVVAGILNLLLAFVVWFISRNKETTGSQSSTAFPAAPGGGSPSRLLYGFLLVAALTGTASFLYEIGWIRMLCLVLGSSTHAFELMLSAFILGLALGGFFIRRRIDRCENVAKTLGFVQLTMGGLALLTLLAYDQTFNLTGMVVKALPKTDQGYLLFNFFSHGLSMLIMLPATICAGMTLPLITYFLISKGYGESSIGRVYSANTIGAIVGVVLGVHVIMPALGLKDVITIGGTIDIVIGLCLLWYVKSHFNRRKWAAAAALLVGFILISIFFIRFDTYKMSSGVFRSGDLNTSNTEILFHKDGKTSSVDVMKYVLNRKENRKGIAISTNGVCVGNLSADESHTISEDNQILLAAIPLSLHPGVRKAATFGMGTGLTAHVLLTDQNLEELDIIEIESAVIEGAKVYGERVANTYNDPRSRIHIEDARAFFSSGKITYDLIVADPTYPWVSGVAGLFSREFYRFINNHINEDGLFVQWLHLYHIDINLVASVIKAVSENFADYAIYFTNDNYISIIAGKRPIAPLADGNVFDIPELRNMLARIGIYRKEDLQLHKLGSKKNLDPLFQSYDIQVNSDYFPVLDLGAVKARYMNADARELIRLRTIALPLVETLEKDPTPRLSRFGTKPINSIADNAAQGMAIYQYFRSLLDPGYFPELTMNEKTSEIVAVIRTMHNKSRFNRGKWENYLVRLMRLTLPYLSPGEMAVIWADIDAAGISSNWTDLFKALGNRDFQQVTRLSATMFPGKVIKSTPTNDYLLTTAMLAFIAVEQPGSAVDLWNRYDNKETPTLALRLLSELAKGVGVPAGGK